MKVRHLLLPVMLVGAAATLAPAAPSSGQSPGLDRRTLRGTIAFVCEHDVDEHGHGENDEVCVMDADGARRRRLTENPGPDRAPAWSPDGRSLAVNSRRGDHPDRPQIYRLDVRTGEAVRVSTGPVEDHRPSWTPDGRAVVFQRGTFAAGFELMRQDLAGGEPTPLTNAPGQLAAAGSYSPSGTRLLYQSNHEAAGLFPFATYVHDLVSGATTRIAADVTASHDGPRWSPDGGRVAFAAGGDLYVVDLATATTTTVTDDDASDSAPAWSPDGTRLVFQSDRSDPDLDDDVDVTTIHIVDLATGAMANLGEGRTPVWTGTVRTPDYGTLPREATAPTVRGFVHRLYLVALDRPAAWSDVTYWSARLAAGESRTRVAQRFAASPEHQRRFGGLTTSEAVERLYTDALRRASDPSGHAYWVAQLDQRRASYAAVLVRFAQAPELAVRIDRARAAR